MICPYCETELAADLSGCPPDPCADGDWDTCRKMREHAQAAVALEREALRKYCEGFIKERDELRNRLITRHREDQRWVAKQMQNTFSQFADIQRKAKDADMYRNLYFSEVGRSSEEIYRVFRQQRWLEGKKWWNGLRSSLAAWFWWKIRPKDKETL